MSALDTMRTAHPSIPANPARPATADDTSSLRKALQEAATFLEPRAVPVHLPKTTLKNREEAQTYLAQLEEVILMYLDEDRPVVIV